MEKTKKIIIITLICIFIFITILVIFLNSHEEDKNNTNNINNNETTMKNYFKKVNNYDEFFSIQNTLNNSNQLNTSYIIQELYLNRIGKTKYYFINCSELESDVGAEIIDYTKNNYYLIIVNNNKYQLNKLNEIEDLENYAKNYKVIEKEITSNNVIKKGNIEEEKMLTIYIEYFKDMLILDTELAYNMLDEETKKDYVNYNDFYNEVINNYNKLSSKIFAYNKQEEDDINTYYIEDDNRNKIIITEYGIMDFKISY